MSTSYDLHSQKHREVQMYKEISELYKRFVDSYYSDKGVDWQQVEDFVERHGFEQLSLSEYSELRAFIDGNIGDGGLQEMGDDELNLFTDCVQFHAQEQSIKEIYS